MNSTFKPIFAITAFILCASSAHAQDTIRFGKAAPTVFQFTPVDLGIEKGIFQKHGLQVEVLGFSGDAKLHQAFAAGVIDMGIGSGAALAFVAKGSPVLGVAEAASPPLGITLTVLKDSPYNTIADLKGKIISGSSVGDQNEWMLRKLSILQGWGPNGFRYVGLGASEAQLSALMTREVAGSVIDLTTAVTLQSDGKTRLLLKFGDVITDYINHVLFATNDVMTKHPDDVRQFLAGWFESVAYFKAHKDEEVKLAARILNRPENIVAQVYDEATPMLTDNGHFEPKGLATLQQSLVDTQLLPQGPDMTKLFTEKFLPN